MELNSIFCIVKYLVCLNSCQAWHLNGLHSLTLSYFQGQRRQNLTLSHDILARQQQVIWGIKHQVKDTL